MLPTNLQVLNLLMNACDQAASPEVVLARVQDAIAVLKSPNASIEDDQKSPEWRVGEFWSSSAQGERCLALQVGRKEIREGEAHHNFIRWVASSKAFRAHQFEAVSEEAILERFERAVRDSHLAKNTPLGKVTFQDEFHHYMDPQTDTLWLGYRAAYRARLPAPGLAATVLPLWRAVSDGVPIDENEDRKVLGFCEGTDHGGTSFITLPNIDFWHRDPEDEPDTSDASTVTHWMWEDEAIAWVHASQGTAPAAGRQAPAASEPADVPSMLVIGEPSDLLRAARELTGHIVDVLTEEEFGKINAEAWNAVTRLAGAAEADPATMARTGWKIARRDDLELGTLEISGEHGVRFTVTRNHGTAALKALHALASALLGSAGLTGTVPVQPG